MSPSPPSSDGHPPSTAHLYQFLAPAQAAGELGRLGPYRVLEVLGQGGMGLVFRAEDTELKRAVALKVMLPQYAADPDARARFLREARAAAAIEHDHIIPIYKIGEDRGTPFIAMRLLRGQTLAAYLKAYLKNRSLPPAAHILQISRQMAEGLAAAHEKGLVHRDVKPANVFLEASYGRVKLLDFGLAKPSTVDSIGLRTATGEALGTPVYMAPEQFSGEADTRSDLYSLGVVLYQMATGVLPFDSPNIWALIDAVKTQSPTPPVAKNPHLHPALSGLIERLLAKDPAARPESAVEVAGELRRIKAARGVTTQAPPPAPVARVDVPSPAAPAAPAKPAASSDPDASAAPDPVTSVAVPAEPGGAEPLSANSWMRSLVVAGVIASAICLVLVVFLYTRPDDLDRKAAESLRHHGEVLVVHVRNGEDVEIRPNEKLPDEPFEVIKILYEEDRVRLPDAYVQSVLIPAVAKLRSLKEIIDWGERLPIGEEQLELLAGQPVAKHLTIIDTMLQPTSRTVMVLRQSFPNLKGLGFDAATANNEQLSILHEQFPDLEYLVLRNAGEEGDISSSVLARMVTPKLRTLGLVSTSLINQHVCRKVAGLPELETLNLWETSVTDGMVQDIGRCAKLVNLNLGYTKISDAGLVYLGSLNRLKHLDLRKTQVTLAGINKLKAELNSSGEIVSDAK